MTANKNITAQAKIREKILASVQEYYSSTFAVGKEFTPGDKINYGGRFFDEKELVNLVDASLDFWLTTGRYCSEFESDFAKFLDVKYCSLTNSGSSANLLAFMALTSAKLGERRVKKGDEVITVAAGFPTTVAPIIQYGAVPVFVDVTLPEYNIDVSMLEKAYSKRTRVVMVAHTLGNPFDLQTVRSFCDEHNLWLIEDNCDALGSEYYINGAWKYTGTIGDIGTSSFYPPHHMTMGEGGAVYTDNSQLYRIINSFRDWGRDCWCASGHDNTCQNRFSQQFGELPLGYDHKYVYSHFGYNLKATEMQAAIGCAQLKKLPFFIKKRRENWQFLWEHLSGLDKYFILPEASQNSKPSWFGFLITVREAAKFSRNEIVTYLEKHNIQTRMLFAGNLIKHPCFDEMRGNNQLYRVVGSLDNTDCIMERTFWLGIYPGIDEVELRFMLTIIRDFLKSR
ncbi:lipopolysaccharide biosynthesis protein RfbH [Pectinatus frisingensis]|uniref:lipopolysaccharide biosynthesis protein RfbH n=1 Tax=Pectinatus frisingensis TaxID=865 RepID=UPI0018C4934C|nr:lipopolysaccharide biosynthesis protein RfbH [Pectinatus frisingensis]